VKNLTLISRVLGLGLGTQVLGLGLGLGIRVLGLDLGLEAQVLVNITGCLLGLCCSNVDVFSAIQCKLNAYFLLQTFCEREKRLGGSLNHARCEIAPSCC